MSWRPAARWGALLLAQAVGVGVAIWHARSGAVSGASLGLRLPEALVVLVIGYAAWTATRAGILAGLIAAAVEFFRTLREVVLLGAPVGIRTVSPPALAELAGYGAATVLLGLAAQRTEAGMPRVPPVAGLPVARVLIGAQLVVAAAALATGVALLATEVGGRVAPAEAPSLVNAGALLTPLLAVAVVALRHPSRRRLLLAGLAQAAWVVIVLSSALEIDAAVLILFALVTTAGVLAVLVRPLISPA